jgi:hypothetical protein
LLHSTPEEKEAKKMIGLDQHEWNDVQQDNDPFWALTPFETKALFAQRPSAEW